MSRIIGIVKWFNETKGYGFIQPKDGGKDIFVHVSAVMKSGLSGLKENDTVSFEIVKDARTTKETAENLKLE